jgi:hypothetical protein
MNKNRFWVTVVHYTTGTRAIRDCNKENAYKICGSRSCCKPTRLACKDSVYYEDHRQLPAEFQKPFLFPQKLPSVTETPEGSLRSVNALDMVVTITLV